MLRDFERVENPVSIGGCVLMVVCRDVCMWREECPLGVV